MENVLNERMNEIKKSRKFCPDSLGQRISMHNTIFSVQFVHIRVGEACGYKEDLLACWAFETFEAFGELAK